MELGDSLVKYMLHAGSENQYAPHPDPFDSPYYASDVHAPLKLRDISPTPAPAPPRRPITTVLPWWTILLIVFCLGIVVGAIFSLIHMRLTASFVRNTFSLVQP